MDKTSQDPKNTANHNKTIFVSIAILLLLIVFGVAVAFFMSKEPQQLVTEVTPRPTTPKVSTGETGNETATNSPATKGTEGSTYNPFTPGNAHTKVTETVTQNDTNKVCYNLKIEGTSPELAPWEVIVNTDTAPFKGNDFTKQPSTIVVSNATSHEATITGVVSENDDFKNVSSTQPVLIENVCAQTLEFSTPIVTAPVEGTILRSSVNGGDRWGQQYINFTNDNQFYSNTTLEIDITELRKMVTKASPDQEPTIDTENGNSITKVEGNIYRVTSSKTPWSVRKHKSSEKGFRITLQI